MKGLGVGKGATFDVDDDVRRRASSTSTAAAGSTTARAPAAALRHAVGAVLAAALQHRRAHLRRARRRRPDTRPATTSRAPSSTGPTSTRSASSRVRCRRPTPSSSGGGPRTTTTTARAIRTSAHNNFYDTIEEVNLVRGVGDEFWGSFGEHVHRLRRLQGQRRRDPAGELAAHGGDHPRHRSRTITRPTRCCSTTCCSPALAQQVLGAGADDRRRCQIGRSSSSSLITDPAAALQNHDRGSGAAARRARRRTSSAQSGVDRHPARQRQGRPTSSPSGRGASIGSTRSAPSSAPGNKKIQVHIRGIWDSAHFNQNTTSGDINDRQGTWVYWRGWTEMAHKILGIDLGTWSVKVAELEAGFRQSQLVRALREAAPAARSRARASSSARRAPSAALIAERASSSRRCAPPRSAARPPCA